MCEKLSVDGAAIETMAVLPLLWDLRSHSSLPNLPVKQLIKEPIKPWLSLLKREVKFQAFEVTENDSGLITEI